MQDKNNSLEKTEILTKAKIHSLLNARFCDDKITKLSEIPHPNALKNMEIIAKKIHQAIKKNKKIVVVGDYDVDGVVSCAILHDFFAKIKYPIEFVIPDRFSEGYGVSPKIIERLKCDIIITVDNGINALSAAQICKERGIELLITDHHTPQSELPNALICNPKLSPSFVEPEICGANVAWYLCGALKKELQVEINLVEFLDFLCLAIISDVMPLRGLNRVLFKKGMEVLKNTKKESLKVLKEHFKKYELNAQTIAFYFAPLLNCAGRVAHAKESFYFLIEKDSKKIRENFEKLLELNQKRKNLQNEIYECAKTDFITQKDYQNLPFILVSGEWNEGVIGIIAARLCNEFLKPCIVLSKNASFLKGSMRSIDGVDCMEVLESCKTFLEGFGGHFSAAGLGLKEENLSNFREALMNFSYKKCENLAQKNVLGFLPLSEIDESLWAVLCDFEPFGNANELPYFQTCAKVCEIGHFGDGHSNVFLDDGSTIKKALRFFEKVPLEFIGKDISCIFTLQWDKYANEVGLKMESYKIL